MTINEIREILKKPVSKHLIGRATKHESRLKLHCQVALDKSSSKGATEFLEWVKTLLTAKDKYKIFLDLFRFPVKTNTLTKKLFESLEKVFDSKNAVFDYSFLSDEILQDWLSYRNELKESEFWRSIAFQYMQTSINSILIVDLPNVQDSERPRPYFYLKELSQLHDFKTDKTGQFEWILFRSAKDKLVLISDKVYQVWLTKEKSSEILSLESESFHDLGYCPANWLWSDLIDVRQPIFKKSPITSELSNLDWLLFFEISKRHLDLYGSYPIIVGYESECDYQDKDSNYCDNGKLKSSEGEFLINEHVGNLIDCPSCSNRQLAGAGSFIEMPIPDGIDGKELSNPIKIIGADVATLKHNIDECERLRNEIFQNVTGFTGETTFNKAINETQVTAIFENRTQILNNLKKNFEVAQKWATKTICKLRYGQSFVSCSISYGTEFYLYNSEYLLQLYTTAKKEGLDDSILDMLQNQYFETKYRNNQKALQRQKILIQLDSFRHLTKKDVIEMFKLNHIDYINYIIKINFSSFISRFERENISIVEFAQNLEFSEKIKRIREGLNSYANELRSKTIKISNDN